MAILKKKPKLTKQQKMLAEYQKSYAAAKKALEKAAEAFREHLPPDTEVTLNVEPSQLRIKNPKNWDSGIYQVEVRNDS